VIHGTLHLVGYRDKTLSEAEPMRAAEAKYLRQFGFDSTSIHEGGTTPQGTRTR
jgi:ssRNA-specific RNase YbeY (16S rRNA maturation enzyme)